jgi:hypothetical protein
VLGDTTDSFPTAARARCARRSVGSGVLASILVAALGLRLLYSFRYAINSDEPQELHVAWAWAHGLLPYRDVFDNHAPLFALLSAPILRLFGETAGIFYRMRLVGMAFYAATIAGTWLIARRIGGRDLGRASASLLALVPVFFFKSLEYRADDLWTALWVLGLAVLLGGSWGRRRSFAAGLLFGAALATSLKTVILLASLGLAGLTLPLALGPGWRRPPARRTAPCLVALACGLALVPAALLLWFALQGALGPLARATVLHNLEPGLGNWGGAPFRALWFAPAAALAVALVRLLLRLPLDDDDRARLGLVTLTSLIYLASIHLLWPLFTTQNFLPFYPLFAIAAARLFEWVRRDASAAALDRVRRGRPAGAASARPAPAISGSGLVLLCAAVQIGLMVAWEPPWRDGTGGEVRLLAAVIRLTGPGDFVLDAKGETVFRRRPIDYVLESVTADRLRRGDLPERIPEQVIARRACVAAGDLGRFPERVRRFLEDNYIAVGELRVAGRLLAPGGAIPFEVAIPERYVIVGERGNAAGSLDGLPYTGPRYLATGRHLFEPAPGAGRLALLWARAAERGFSPFPPFGAAPGGGPPAAGAS